MNCTVIPRTVMTGGVINGSPEPRETNMLPRMQGQSEKVSIVFAKKMSLAFLGSTLFVLIVDGSESC